MGNHNNVKQGFAEICKLSERYSKVSAIRSSESRGIQIRNSLKSFGRILLEIVSSEAELELHFQYSKGQSNLPRVFWIAILPKGRKVSNHSSVAICFSPDGKGAVSGIMDSVSSPQGLASAVRRNKGKMMIDLDSRGAKYNNKFINPLELEKDSFDPDKFVKHLVSSVSLMKELLDKKYAVTSYW